MDLASKQGLLAYLKNHHLWSQKSLGQNFLIDRDALHTIVQAMDLQATDTILEIGPGIGALTYAIAPKIHHGLLLAVEKDFRFVERLRREFKNAQQVKIIHEDIRRFDVCSIKGEYKVVGNIPYYLTSRLIRTLLEGRCNSPRIKNHKPLILDSRFKIPRLIVLTVQKEVAERITAKPGDSNRGLLTIMVELMAESELMADIPRSSFYPEPDVDSTIMRLHPRPLTTYHLPLTILHLAKAGFSAKRRQLYNSLAGGLRLPQGQVRDILKEARVNGTKRAEDLTIREWQQLAKIWRSHISGD